MALDLCVFYICQEYTNELLSSIKYLQTLNIKVIVFNLFDELITKKINYKLGENLLSQKTMNTNTCTIIITKIVYRPIFKHPFDKTCLKSFKSNNSNKSSCSFVKSTLSELMVLVYIM